MTTEETVAAMEVTRLCDWCRRNHFKSYPEQPESTCYLIYCDCWCTEPGRLR